MGLQTDNARREAGEAVWHTDVCIHPSAMRIVISAVSRRTFSLSFAIWAMFAPALAIVIADAAQRRGVANANAGAGAVDLLIVGGAVVTMNPDRRVIENGFVAIKGQRIFDVGDAAELKTKGYK